MSWATPRVWATSEVVSAANMNTFISNDLTALYGDTAWTAVVFANSWIAFDTTAQYRLIGTRVALQGSMKSGTNGATAFTLAVGYRPTANRFIPVLQGGGTAGGFIRVGTDGTVVPTLTVATTSGFYMDGSTFDTI